MYEYKVYGTYTGKMLRFLEVFVSVFMCGNANLASDKRTFQADQIYLLLHCDKTHILMRPCNSVS